MKNSPNFDTIPLSAYSELILWGLATTLAMVADYFPCKEFAREIMKKSFILHADSLDVLEHLSDEQCGQLLRAFKAYHSGDAINLPSLLTIAFSPFKNQFERDLESYEKVCNRNKINGSKGGRPRNPVGSLGTQVNPSKPKKADSVNDSVNDSDSEKHLFDLFWKNYPRKQDKIKSEKAFSKLTKEKKEKATLDCKTRFKDIEPRFIPLATTYINGERWEDEIIEVKIEEKVRFPRRGDCDAWVSFAFDLGLKPNVGELQNAFERRITNHVETTQ